MAIITAKLIKDGNSIALRLPKTVLAMSGLHDEVQMEVEKGRVTLRQAHSKHPRAGWEDQIAHVIATDPHALDPDPELEDWDHLAGDGLDD